jgi:hypothetical protein
MLFIIDKSFALIFFSIHMVSNIKIRWLREGDISETK